MSFIVFRVFRACVPEGCGLTAAYPDSSLVDALEKMAQHFYPHFRNSLIGKTLAPMMGKKVPGVLKRMAVAYRISVPWNDHEFALRGPSSAEWTCTVEPCAYYPATFRGIVRGTMESHDLTCPEVEVTRSARLGDRQRIVFDIRW